MDSGGYGVVEPGLNELAERVIGAAIAVHRELGPGFAEATYAKAMQMELTHCQVSFETERPVQLLYRSERIGRGKIDLLVEGRLVVELKATEANPWQYRRQVVAYLRAGGFQVGLIINFGLGVLKDGICRVINT